MSQDLQILREKKQQYLRTEVLEKGFEPDDFVQYLTSNLNMNADIDTIGLDELKKVVQNFKKDQQEKHKHHESSKQTKVEYPVIESIQIIKQEQKPSNIIKNIVYEKFLNQSIPEFQSTFKCVKSNFNSKNPPYIQVSDPKRQSSGGIFGIGAVSYLMFKITTLEFKWEVRRRYSDFQWLRSAVTKFYPTYIIPPIPKKNAAKKTLRDLQKRMRILTYFLNDLAMIPQIFNSKYVQGFMSLTSYTKFEQLKKEALNRDYYHKPSHLQTSTGQCTIKLSNDRKIYIEQMQKYLNGAQVLYKGITKNSKLLQNQIIQETNTLYTMGNQFAELHGLMKNFNNKIPPTSEQRQLNHTYITLNNMMVQWGNFVKNTHNYLQKNFNTFFRYMRNQIYSVRELLTKVTEIQSQFFKNKLALDKKKQKIFSLGDINKWEVPNKQLTGISALSIKNKPQAFKIMLPKESEILELQKINYAYYSSQFYDHSSACLQKASARFCDNFKEFAIDLKINNQQLISMWTEIGSNFADPSKKLVKGQEIPKNEVQIQDG